MTVRTGLDLRALACLLALARSGFLCFLANSCSRLLVLACLRLLVRVRLLVLQNLDDASAFPDQLLIDVLPLHANGPVLTVARAYLQVDAANTLAAFIPCVYGPLKEGA